MTLRIDAIFLVVSAFICSKRDSRLVHCKKNNEKTEIKPAFQLEFPNLCVPELDLSHWTGVVPFVQLLSRILAKHLLSLNDKLNGDQLNYFGTW